MISLKSLHDELFTVIQSTATLYLLSTSDIARTELLMMIKKLVNVSEDLSLIIDSKDSCFRFDEDIDSFMASI